MMIREYKYYCSGCKKPDKDFPLTPTGEDVYGSPSINMHRWARYDVYGIFTGIYCDDCYNSDDSDRYPYKKTSYAHELEHNEHIWPEEERY